MAKKVISQRCLAIVDAVCYWQGYQFKIGREQLIHEASLRYPVADTITAEGIAIQRVVLEKLHPIFKSKKIDLVIYEEGTTELDDENDDSKLKEVFEFKLAKSDTSKQYGVEHQRVFDDVVRLAYYNLWSKKDCYFLISGKYEDFKSFFIGQISQVDTSGGKNNVKQTKAPTAGTQVLDTNVWKSGGLYGDWFSFIFNEEKEHEFKVSDPTNGKGWGLAAFKKNYDVRDEIKKSILTSIKIRTTCMAITPAGLGDRTHAAGIWKIEGLSES